MMGKKLFEQLAEIMRQMGEITRGERAPLREFHLAAVGLTEVGPDQASCITEHPRLG